MEDNWETLIQGIYKRMVRFQKLTRNLFLNLHWHNVHRQQRQMSKFLMRYQQFASRAYCGAAGPVSKMVSQQEKAFCVLRFEVSRSVITVQREFRARFTKDAWCVFSKPRTDGNAWETWTVAAADGVRCARVRWEINFLLTFETAPFFCVYPVCGGSLVIKCSEGRTDKDIVRSLVLRGRDSVAG